VLDLWADRVARLTAAREAALRRLTHSAAGDMEAQARLLAELEELQESYCWGSCVFVNAVHGTLMSPIQFARYLVASQPWCPSLASLHAALLAIRAERGASGCGGSGGGGGSAASAPTSAGGGPPGVGSGGASGGPSGGGRRGRCGRRGAGGASHESTA
jgi:hypothetical protein